VCRKTVPLVKVLCANHEVSYAIWEPEQEMQAKYPRLFLYVKPRKFNSVIEIA